MSLIIIFVGMLSASILGLVAMWIMGDGVVDSMWANQVFLLLVWGSLLLAVFYELCVWTKRLCQATRVKCLCRLLFRPKEGRPDSNRVECVKILVCGRLQL